MLAAEAQRQAMFPTFHKPEVCTSSLGSPRSRLNTFLTGLPLVPILTSWLADILTRSRQLVPYVPCNKPLRRIFEIQCHPRADAVCAKFDSLFMKHWPFKSQRERNRFSAARTNRWACLAFPTAHDDHLLDTVDQSEHAAIFA